VTNNEKQIDTQAAERDLRAFGSLNTLNAVESLEGEIRDAKQRKDLTLVADLQWKYINQQSVQQIENPHVLLTLNRKDMLLIEARNRRVKDGLQKKYKGGLEEEDLNVFFVSNKFYGDYCCQGSETTSNEKGTMSGIPALRKFCYSTVANSRLQEAKNFLLTTLPTFLDSIALRSQTLDVGPSCPTTETLENIERVKQTVCQLIHP
jgi:hypothetical protein